MCVCVFTIFLVGCLKPLSMSNGNLSYQLCIHTPLSCHLYLEFSASRKYVVRNTKAENIFTFLKMIIVRQEETEMGIIGKLHTI